MDKIKFGIKLICEIFMGVPLVIALLPAILILWANDHKIDLSTGRGGTVLLYMIIAEAAYLRLVYVLIAGVVI